MHISWTTGAVVSLLLCCATSGANAADLTQARNLQQAAPAAETAPTTEGTATDGAPQAKALPTGLPGSGELGTGRAGAACCAQLAAAGFKSNLPVVVIDTAGQPLVGKTPTNATLCTCGAAGLPGGDYDGPATVNYRGGSNSNSRNVLKSMTLKLPKGDGKEHFVGLDRANSFILYQPQNDTLALHEWLGLNLTRASGEFAAGQQFIETFINTKGGALVYPRDYIGVQLAEQKLEQGKNLIDVSKTKATTPPEAAGYILEFTHGESDPRYVVINGTTTNTPWNLWYPQSDVATPAQIAYISKALNGFETALFSPQFTSPVTGWRAYANETTFADWWLAAELIKNAKHSYHGADFCSKDGPGLLSMGPFTLPRQGFGYCCGYPIEGYQDGGVSGPGKSGGSAISPNGWLFDICDNPERCIKDPTYGLSVWFRQLWLDPGFQQLAARRFQELRAGPWSDAAVAALIDAQEAVLQPAALRTLAKYLPLGLIWSPGKYPTPAAGYAATFAQLRQWTLARLAWMEGQLASILAGKLPPELTVNPVDLERTRLESQPAKSLAAGPAPTTPQVDVPAQLAAAG